MLSAREKRSAETTRSPTFRLARMRPVINQKLRSGWDRLMNPVGRGLARMGLTPNWITLAGVALHIPVALLILEGSLLAAGLLAVVAAFFDSFDGAVAKARGTTSRFGALLDSTTDRIADALYFIPLAWLFAVSPDTAEHAENWVAAAAIAAMVAGFMVSYVKARAESLGFSCDVGIAERAERLIIIIISLVFDVVPAGVTLLAVLSTITFLQRLWHVWRQAETLKSAV
jgi:CDP-diacylglycerol---glycerol-3-phosphate 3-phosphatidyltransferase